MPSPFELSANQLNAFLARNPLLPELISNAIQIGFWPNGQDLTAGFAVIDSVYGNVLMSEDAQGYLHYIANNPQDPSATNAPVFDSGAAQPQQPNPCLGSIEGFLQCVEGDVTWFAGAALLLWWWLH